MFLQVVIQATQRSGSTLVKNTFLPFPGADPENSERGCRDTCPLASYIDNFFNFSENSRKTIQKFKETGLKRDGRGPLAPPLNPLLFAPSSPSPFALVTQAILRSLRYNFFTTS